MDNDWDLYAVVRGCAAATRSPTPTPTTPLPILPSNQIQFPNLVDQNSDRFMGLQEIYQHFMTNYARQRPPTPAVMPAPPPQMVPVAPPLMQRLPPAALPQHLRLRRSGRKNLPAKIVRQMTQEELSADSWAWRKYGQKPIKGSPYPRNYYRCSTSKGCGARKQVERSTYDAGIFVVSYTGEHTHARPTHRSSLSGTTRARFPARNNNGVLLHKAPAPAQAPAPAPALSSPSPSVGSSLSPATPSNGGGDGQIDDAENVIQLPDDLMINDEDMFGGFQDSDNSSGGGDFFTAGFLTSPPWSPAESSGNAAAFNGGGHLE